MLKTTQLPILTGRYAEYDYNLLYFTDWGDSSELFAARSAATYFFSKLSFNTNDVKIRGKAGLFLELTALSTSNPYGTSLILTTSELTPAQVHALTTEEQVKATEGFVAYAHCTSHTSSGNISAGAKFSYKLTDVDIEKDKTYYIYIKRRIGWNNSGSGVNGLTHAYNPSRAASADTARLELSFEPDGTMVFHNGEWRNGTTYIRRDGAWVSGMTTVHKGE